MGLELTFPFGLGEDLVIHNSFFAYYTLSPFTLIFDLILAISYWYRNNDVDELK